VFTRIGEYNIQPCFPLNTGIRNRAVNSNNIYFPMVCSGCVWSRYRLHIHWPGGDIILVSCWLRSGEVPFECDSDHALRLPHLKMNVLSARQEKSAGK
jgi:hypothetical protein